MYWEEINAGFNRFIQARKLNRALTVHQNFFEEEELNGSHGD